MKRFEMTQLFALLGINGPDLLLRSYGQHAFPTLEHALKEVPPGQALLLDFAGVSVKAKVALLIRKEDQMRLIGHVEPNLMEAWQLVYEKSELTARELADQRGLEINTASMRLRKLYDARLLARREEITPDGRQHIYMLPI